MVFKTGGPKGEKISFIINSIGNKPNSGCKSEILEYYTNQLFVALGKMYNIEKFILISSGLVTRPYNIITYYLNSKVDTVMHWKLIAENKLRESGLNYAILRPMGLLGEKEAE